MEEEKKFTPPPRECDGCTMCCEGWVSAEALGKVFFPGQPCHWVGCNGCTVYEDRPKVCSDFICGWKASHFLPEWFKPNLADIITIWRTWKSADICEPKDRGGIYLAIIECGKPMENKILTWLNNYVQAGVLNVKYQSHGRWHWMGSEEFCDWCISGGDIITEQTTKPQ